MPTKPGIYLRGGNKSTFEEPGKEIGERELVYAIDTKEIGTIDGWFDPFMIGRGAIGVINYQFDSTQRTFGTSWAVGKEWAPVSFKGGSRIRIDWRIPMRNDSSSWGGGFTDIEFSYDDGATWISIGSSGYDGPMAISGDIITSMNGAFTFTDCPEEDFIMKIRFKHRSHDGTLNVNGEHAIESGAYGAFWTNITFTEIYK